VRFSENPERNTAIIWFVISAGSFILAIILAMLTFTSIITVPRFFPPVFLAGLSVLGIFFGFSKLSSAKRVDALIGGNGLLLHWTYRYEDILPFLDDEKKNRERTRNVVLFFFALVLVLGMLFCFTASSVDFVAIGIYFGLLLLTIAMLYKGLPAMGYGTTGVTEFYLGNTSALFGGRFHSWDKSGGNLEHVEFHEGKPAFLSISYRHGALLGSQAISLNIPIPPRREQEVKDLFA